MKFTSLMLTVVLASSAFAGVAPAERCKKPEPKPKPPVVSPKPPQPKPQPTQTQTYSGEQNQQQNQNQGQSQSANASNGDQANSQATSLNSNYQEVRQTPLAYAPTIFNGDCQKSLSGGASSPLAAISLGGSRTDKDCQALRLAQAFVTLNNLTAAAKVLCSTDASKRAKLTLEDCMGFVAISETKVASQPQVVERIIEVPAAPQPPVQITFNAPPSLPPVTVDPPKPVAKVKKRVVRKTNKKPIDCAVPVVKGK